MHFMNSLGLGMAPGQPLSPEFEFQIFLQNLRSISSMNKMIIAICPRGAEESSRQNLSVPADKPFRVTF